MIVCHCTGATDRDIKALVREGRSATALEVSRASSAGRGCGGCALAIECLVRSEERSLRSKADMSVAELVPAL